MSNNEVGTYEDRAEEALLNITPMKAVMHESDVMFSALWPVIKDSIFAEKVKEIQARLQEYAK